MAKFRGQWSGQWAFILAAAGAAIGLGNIWKFPYMAGDNGGSAFVIVYLACVVLIGLPVMAAEILIGRRAQKNSIDALKDMAKESKRSKHWSLLGWWGLLGLLITLSFYSVVAGWSIFYLIKTAVGGFNHDSAHQVVSVWTQFLADPGRLLMYHAVFMVLTILVLARGVQKGLERASLIMMPLLFLVLIILVVYAFVSTGPAFGQAFHYLFSADFHKITGPVVINALGHAFFTLAIGVGAMSVYGSYLPKQISIGQSVAVTALLDVLVALLAGLAIFPILFAHHLSPAQGPGLMFVTLPIAFANMTEGQWVGVLFFVLLLFAAWTSSINIAEPLVAALYERTKLSRVQACWVIGLIAWGLGIVSVLSFNVWSHVKLFGHFDLFTAITDLSTNIFLPIGGIFYAIFAGWMMWREYTQVELAFRQKALYLTWRFLTRYIAPLGILLVFLDAVLPHGIFSLF